MPWIGRKWGSYAATLAIVIENSNHRTISLSACQSLTGRDTRHQSTKGHHRHLECQQAWDTDGEFTISSNERSVNPKKQGHPRTRQSPDLSQIQREHLVRACNPLYQRALYLSHSPHKCSPRPRLKVG
jgi:hypothetical protein